MYLVDGLSTERLERLEVLERHRLLVDLGGRRVDPLERQGEALGAQDRGLAVALGAQDLGLLGALGDVDRRLSAALRLGDHGASRPFGRELPVHRVLDVAWRGDLADLDGRHLAAPPLGHLVELDPQGLVDRSRLESTSSRRMSPTTARNVVVAMFWRAPLKSWTSTTLLYGSTIRQ